MSVGKRVPVNECLCGRSQSENERTGTENGFSQIESIAPVCAEKYNPSTVGVCLQQVEPATFSGSIPGLAAGVGAERSRYRPNQSAKTLLKKFF